jgi:hypothetical protein
VTIDCQIDNIFGKFCNGKIKMGFRFDNQNNVFVRTLMQMVKLNLVYHFGFDNLIATYLRHTKEQKKY